LPSIQNWIDLKLALFDPSQELFSGGLLANLKHCSELVLVLGYMQRSNVETQWATRLLHKLWDDVFGQGQLIRDVVLARPDMLPIIGVYSNMKASGLHSEDLDRLVALVAKEHWPRYLPLPAWRLIDIYNSLDRLGALEFPIELKRDCWICSFPSPSILSVEICYAITHEIFYLTDFGRLENRLSGSERNYIKLALPTWKDYAKRKDDLDLFAEFLLTEYCLSGHPTSMDFAYCKQKQLPDGSFAGPLRARKELECQSSSEFHSNYHTTLVSRPLRS
jgi:hypothetical protein